MILPFHENAVTWVDTNLNLVMLRKEGRRIEYCELINVLFKEVFDPDSRTLAEGGPDVEPCLRHTHLFFDY